MKLQKAPTTLRVRLTETHTFTRHFEVAGWYELVECAPQEPPGSPPTMNYCSASMSATSRT